jgi:hypothetical protein
MKSNHTNRTNQPPTPTNLDVLDLNDFRPVSFQGIDDVLGHGVVAVEASHPSRKPNLAANQSKTCEIHDPH